MLDQHGPGPLRKLPRISLIQDGRQVDPLQQPFGHGSLGVGKTQGPDELERGRIMVKRTEHGRLDCRRAGQQVAGIVEHDRPPVNGSDSLENRSAIEPGNGHLEGSKTVRPHAEHGERGLAAVNRRFPAREPGCVALEVTPEPGALCSSTRCRLADSLLGDDERTAGAIRRGLAEIGSLEQRVNKLRLDVNLLAQPVAIRMRLGLLPPVPRPPRHRA